MNIEQAKAAIRVGQIVVSDKHEKKIKFVPDQNISAEKLNDVAGRVYFITVNKVIEKIGASQDRLGIRGTISAYCGGFGGKPSMRTYGVCNFMYKEALKGNIVEFYVIFAPMIEVLMPKLDGTSELRKVPVESRNLEDSLLNEYVKVENRYPKLNLQEKHEKWSTELIDEGFYELINKKK